MRKKIMKTMFAMLLCALTLMVLPNVAAQAKTKNRNKGKAGKSATWTYNEKKKVLTIAGKGAVRASDLLKEDKSGDFQWLGREEGNLPMFRKIVIEEGITAIDYDFFCLENVKSISLPKSFKKIQYNYRNINEINGQMDPWSTTLTKIVVHKKNKKFKVFKGILLSKDGKKLYVFPASKSKDVYRISNKITEIRPYAFWGADIQKVIIGNKVTKIGASAFRNSTLKEVTFGKSLKRIGDSAFRGCALSNMNFPDSLTYIGQYAFCRCPITELTIPSKVAVIEYWAFGHNHELKKIVFQGNAKISHGAFYSTVDYDEYKNEQSTHIELPITVVIGKNVKVNVADFCSCLGSRITFQVEPGNAKYYVKDGNLYTIRGNKLVYEFKKEEEKPETPPVGTTTGSAVQI